MKSILQILMLITPLLCISQDYNGDLRAREKGIVSVHRGRLGFSNAYTDWNHVIYNNGLNIDGEGNWDGMKFNVYAGASFRVGSSRFSSLFLDNAGNIGMGTTSPDGLEVRSTISSEDSNGTDNIRFGIKNGTPRIILDESGFVPFEIDNALGKFRIYNPGIERLIITAGGKIGIGVSEPAYKMHINQPDGAVQLRLERSGSAPGFSDIGSDQNGLNFWSGGYDGSPDMLISTTGNVGIGTGTIAPDSKLTVKGGIHSQEVKVDLDGAIAPDFVFEDTYDLMSLAETEKYIQTNKHLPEIPSAKEMEEEGIELKLMNLKLLQKIEELTLYMIDMNKRVNELETENQELKKRYQR